MLWKIKNIYIGIFFYFPVTGSNEKNIYKEKKKIFRQNLKWATAHLSRRLGAGRGARGAAARRQGAWARGALTRGAWGAAGAWQAGRGGAEGTRPRRWARGLGAQAKGYALGALSLFLARFDSVFFRSQIFGHCS